MIGKTISHYKILEKLGGGGMGVVYKAQDTKLDRTVALKFLPQHLLADKETEQRFISEAKAASSFDHPNICTIHDIGKTDDDQLFIAMACYEGETIKKKLEKGPIKIEEAIDVAVQIAEGLKKAHQKGIIHRDIKPANIFVTNDGFVKILDFGLAKTLNEPGVTKIGTTLGTVAYMSPEQAKGEQLDYRTDIWSFGVVLYEMLVGELPFKGDYEQAIIYSILNEEPKLPTGLRADISQSVSKIIITALKKRPDDRYQEMKELISVLKGVTDSSKNNDPQLKRLAVLPFANISGDPQTDFLGFALADQVIGAIVYFKNLLVRPSSSVRKFQNETFDLSTTGRELNVEYILTGNYLKMADRIRLNIELVELRTEKMIWREPIEVDFNNAFELQDIVAQKVVEGLNVQFSQKERNRIRKDVPNNPLAYEYYLRSISYPSTTEGDLLAIEMLNKSIQLDSSYAPAFSELGYHRQRYGNYGLAGAQEIGKAEEAYLRALSLNDELLNAMWHLSILYTETARTEKAVELARRMLMINPNNAQAHHSLGYVYRYAGMLEESEKEYDQALEIDPGNPRFRSAAMTYESFGKYEKALLAINLDKGSSFALVSLARIFYRQGDNKQSIESWNKLLAQEPTGWFSFIGKAMKAVIKGEAETAKMALSELEQANPADSELWSIVAEAYGLLGDAGSSARALEEGVIRGYFNYPFMVSNSFFDRVRSAPEFQRVLEMAKVRHNNFREQFFSE